MAMKGMVERACFSFAPVPVEHDESTSSNAVCTCLHESPEPAFRTLHEKKSSEE